MAQWSIGIWGGQLARTRCWRQQWFKWTADDLMKYLFIFLGYLCVFCVIARFWMPLVGTMQLLSEPGIL